MKLVLKKMTIVLFTCFLLMSTSAGNAAAPRQDSTAALDAAFTYLASQQSADGGMLGLAGASDSATTARMMLALAANGKNPSQFTSADGRSLVDYLTAAYPDYIYDENGLLFPGNAGLILAALNTAAAAPPQLSAELAATLQEDGSYATAANAEFTSGAVTDLSQAFAIIGLAQTHQDIPPQAITYLVNRQAADGSWDNGFGSDPDTTAIVVIALISSRQVNSDHAAIQAALTYFRSTQQDNGGWKPGWDNDPINVDTTGWISQALITAGEALSQWNQGEYTPISALISQQQADGSIGGTYVNAYSTVEAVFGLSPFSILNTTTFAAGPPDTMPNQAGLVIQLTADNVIQQCLPIPDGEFFGLDLLKAATLDLDIAVDPAMGSLVCGIAGTGCPLDDCFCDMPNYWSYWILTDGQWGYAQTGAGTLSVEAGSVQGWSWGDTPPPPVTYDQLCRPAAQVIPATALPTPIAATPAPATQTTVVATDPAATPIVEVESVPSETNYTLYYLFGGLLVVLVVVIIVYSSRRK